MSNNKEALQLLDMMKNFKWGYPNLIDYFRNIKDKYGRYDAIIKEKNVLYPVEMREALIIKRMLENIGVNPKEWKERLEEALQIYVNNIESN